MKSFVDKYHFLNNKFVVSSEAKVDIFDLGFLRGWGVFDYTLAHGKKPIHLLEHLRRLEASAKLLSLRLPYSIDDITDLTLELLSKNSYTLSDLCWVLTGGIDESKNQSTFAILNHRYKAFPKTHYSNGVKIISADFKREIPAAKTLNYGFAFSMHQKMKKMGAFELLYAPNNIVLECSTSNIFMANNRQLITPREDILLGITRADVIKLAKENNIPVIERQINKMELLSADEVFITASSKNIMPVTKIDNKNIGNGEPGPATKKLIEQYKNPTR